MTPAAPRSPAGPLLAAAIVLGAIAVLYLLFPDPLLVGSFVAGLAITFLMLLLSGRRRPAVEEVEEAPATDVALLRAVADSADIPVAVTDAEGVPFCANQAYVDRFGAATAPADLLEGRGGLDQVAMIARRDGRASLDAVLHSGVEHQVEAVLSGGHLVWSFRPSSALDLVGEARRLLGGEAGRRIGEAGVMAVLTNAEGTVLAASPAFARRALREEEGSVEGEDFVGFLGANEAGQFLFASEGSGATPLRIIQIPVEDGEQGCSLFLLFDDAGAPRITGEQDANIHLLLDSLPLGLALANADGRFTYLNNAFRRAAGLGPGERPSWPGDLLVDEDKGPVSDLVRRLARGRAMAGDIAVRLKVKSDEPVALTVASARGLGEAAVLLSLKDNSEEARLKREVAQATKMQAVGQLAGGVAHDFNNILTAIIGHCDLMLMRHTPGDSDYDDIQQIKSNSNRAAGLTRQLLAFSRQQTLRPQVLQLPDVIAEVSNLLKRLLGETVTLQVKHGRNLGSVRADPGQLEQVIVNLAVNARDAMLAKNPTGGGTLTIQTFSCPAEEVRKMGTDILPVADYTGLKVVDTGTGIPQHLIGKIFEPFFTTKEVGKGTGLGLSTVYGIVKQSGGFIFADSEEGEGTTFTIYLPVYKSEAAAAPKKVKDKSGELWGTGTVLLVEDEAMVRAVAERALTRHGYTVLTAENGEAALEILGREGKVDLMISDVVMPTMDGPTTVREARKMHPDLPILFISGYAEEQLRKSIDLERVSFLAKPFSVQTLAEAARDTLGAAATK